MKISEIYKLPLDHEFELVALVNDSITLKMKNGNEYIKVEFRDSSGIIEGRVWENVEELGPVLEKKSIVRIKGKTTEWNGTRQVVIHRGETVPPDSVDLSEIYPSAPVDTAQMKKNLMDIIGKINSRNLRELVASILFGKEYKLKFECFPAAKKIHHAYIGGLMHHTVTVANLLLDVSGHYPMLDRDILLAGGILHDIGKLEELTIDGGFSYSDRGKLMGHVYMGAEIVEKYSTRIKGLNREKVELLKHIILSHHGNLEFGSPVIPKTPEAILVHHVEYMDSRINHIASLIQSKKLQENNNTKWTDYSKVINSEIFVMDEMESIEDSNEKKSPSGRLFDD